LNVRPAHVPAHPPSDGRRPAGSTACPRPFPMPAARSSPPFRTNNLRSPNNPTNNPVQGCDPQRSNRLQIGLGRRNTLAVSVRHGLGRFLINPGSDDSRPNMLQDRVCGCRSRGTRPVAEPWSWTWNGSCSSSSRDVVMKSRGGIRSAARKKGVCVIPTSCNLAPMSRRRCQGEEAQ